MAKRLGFVRRWSNQYRQSCKKYSNHQTLASKYYGKNGSGKDAMKIHGEAQASLRLGNADK